MIEKLGNLYYSSWRAGWAGNVCSPQGESPAITCVNGGGYRPHDHGEWIDTHFGNHQVGVFGASLCSTSMSSNQRFVIVEL